MNMRELGCSKCRYSPGGCARCRNPSFRPRNAASREELRQLVQDQRRSQSQLKRQNNIQRRRHELNTTRTQQKESLINRLRRHVGSPIPDHRSTAKRRHSNNDNDNSSSSPDHTEAQPPPTKFRRVDRKQDITTPIDNNTIDIDAMDIDSDDINTNHQQQNTNRKRNFIELLTDEMTRRRQSSAASPPPLTQEHDSSLANKLLPPAKRRRKHHSATASPSKIDTTNTTHTNNKGKDPRISLWEPPVSPYGLIEEELYDNPWKLLVSCMLLNKTSGTQVRQCIWELFKLCPTPEAAIAADTSAIEELIHPLGLYRKRAVALQRFSEEYLKNEWNDPTELYGIGKYAADAYYIFCRGMWREVNPEDKDLKRYKEWLEQSDGLGTGLIRHRTIASV